MGYVSFIAARHLRSGRNNSFFSFITAIAVLGVMLGTATLIIALSVLGGFEREITEKVVGFTSHVQILGFQNQGLRNFRESMVRITRAYPVVTAIAPFVSREALIRSRIPGDDATNEKLRAEACAEWRKVLKLDPKNEDAKKEMEHYGYSYEDAEGSFELMIKRHTGEWKHFFALERFKVSIQKDHLDRDARSEALIKIRVGNETEITAAEGDGPVNALDMALRKALDKFYPELRQIHLTDYKVRVLDTQSATAAKVRVLIETKNGETSWNTVGVSPDVVEASWKALVDSISYHLLKHRSGESNS